MSDKPTVSRIVHYVLPESSPQRGAHRAAIIAEVLEKGTVNLNVFASRRSDMRNVSSFPITLAENVPFDPEGKQLNSWHWPERE